MTSDTWPTMTREEKAVAVCKEALALLDGLVPGAPKVNVRRGSYMQSDWVQADGPPPEGLAELLTEFQACQVCQLGLLVAAKALLAPVSARAVAAVWPGDTPGQYEAWLAAQRGTVYEVLADVLPAAELSEMETAFEMRCQYPPGARSWYDDLQVALNFGDQYPIDDYGRERLARACLQNVIDNGGRLRLPSPLDQEDDNAVAT